MVITDPNSVTVFWRGATISCDNEGIIHLSCNGWISLIGLVASFVYIRGIWYTFPYSFTHLIIWTQDIWSTMGLVDHIHSARSATGAIVEFVQFLLTTFFLILRLYLNKWIPQKSVKLVLKKLLCKYELMVYFIFYSRKLITFNKIHIQQFFTWYQSFRLRNPKLFYKPYLVFVVKIRKSTKRGGQPL